MSDTITILGQRLKHIVPKDGEPCYETADVEEDPCIRAWAPNSMYGHSTWQISILGNSNNLPLAEGATLEEAEVALVEIIKKYESSSRKYLSSLTNLIDPMRTISLEQGPASLVVNGRTFVKFDTKLYYKLLVEEYRTHNSFVLNRRVLADSPEVPLWYVCYEGYEGHERGEPEIALRDALESVRTRVKNASDDLKKRQEVLKSFEDLAKDLEP